MTTFYRLENRRRDRAEGSRPPKGAHLETIEKFDLAPGRYLSVVVVRELTGRFPLCAMRKDMSVVIGSIHLISMHKQTSSVHLCYRYTKTAKAKRLKEVQPLLHTDYPGPACLYTGN